MSKSEGACVCVCVALLLVATLSITATEARLLDFQELGGIPNDSSLSTCWANSLLLNATFASLRPKDTLYFPNTTFYLMGGIYAFGLRYVELVFDGTLKYSDDEKQWPRYSDGSVMECMLFEDIEHVVFTSTHQGLIDGSGGKWWGLIKYLEIAENRPRLIHIENSASLLVENLYLKNSPYWTFYANDIAGLEISHCVVDARRDHSDHHDPYDLTAFNTDGFDVAGRDVWIHDSRIWNDDDCIAVKEMDGGGKRSTCSENMLFERINASGVGLTVGSIGPSPRHTCVRNITFRDCIMPNSFKGIYMKSRPGNPGDTGEITDVLYENIRIDSPTQWAIWIGPQQAGYSDACSLAWPFDPFASCPVPAGITWSDITFRNVTIVTSTLSPGVLLGNVTNPMRNIVFDNVRAIDCGNIPWFDKYYYCEGIEGGVAVDGTFPVPPCFGTSSS